jgi:hypothetical protein
MSARPGMRRSAELVRHYFGSCSSSLPLFVEHQVIHA